MESILDKSNCTWSNILMILTMMIIVSFQQEIWFWIVGLTNASYLSMEVYKCLKQISKQGASNC